jgi:hypothetical protein
VSGPNHRRGTTNRNDRGSSRDRARRRAFLLAKFGDGTTAPCQAEQHHEECTGTVTDDTVSADRWPLAGADGGRYTRDNIRPVFWLCNSLQGGLMRAAAMREGS